MAVSNATSTPIRGPFDGAEAFLASGQLRGARPPWAFMMMIMIMIAIRSTFRSPPLCSRLHTARFAHVSAIRDELAVACFHDAILRRPVGRWSRRRAVQAAPSLGCRCGLNAFIQPRPVL